MEGATGSHHYMNPDSRVCQVCGQFHEQHGPHLYDYHESVDEDLVCHICLQPLVSPLDTKCGHTFCGRCIKNYLSMNDACPVDRSPLSSSQLMLATHMVRRLLDKLLVVCPNVDYCEAVLPRCELESHLQHRCHGVLSPVRCAGKLGCPLPGPRGAYRTILWECQVS
ncbi:PREDICTED: ligand of Numb protein X 2-like [Priapulus caudatus]|uniref:Ligand of Numb protein X 2-like n=1 Tax=Priapulus caudatus TaxID=37621 RepID=A0ABM1ENK7_PRICU|nr:PREDICTED: ligand of Numb protein X 2-like [Priapulus caudatus]